MSPTVIPAPTYTIGGSAPGPILAATRDARQKLRETMKALEDLRPNTRDYIGNKEGHVRALAQYNAWFASLDKLHNELEDFGVSVADQIKE